MAIEKRFGMSLTAFGVLLAAVSLSQAQYSGGSGTADDPYRIATASDLIILGDRSEDYDKHFVVTADIDLDPDQPGGGIFGRAVIAPDADESEPGFQGHPFVGTLEGGGHVISRLHIQGGGFLGLFGVLGAEGVVTDLNLAAVDVNGTGTYVAGLVAYNDGGTIGMSHCSGTVSADSGVGGVVGSNRGYLSFVSSDARVEGSTYIGDLAGHNAAGGSIANSYAAGLVMGDSRVGGLVGSNHGDVRTSYSAAAIDGGSGVGGLVGYNTGSVATSYSLATVRGRGVSVGGLVGNNVEGGAVSGCYSIGTVTGSSDVGGLVGANGGDIVASFWDVDTSARTESAGGTGLTTSVMRDIGVFLEAGWDLAGETVNGSEDVWKMVDGVTYPLLFWQRYGGGKGEPDDPYLIYGAEDLNALGVEPNDYDKHFRLMADIDLSGYVYDRAVIAPDMNDVEQGFQGEAFTGVFDGNGYALAHLTVGGWDYLGLLGRLESGGEVRNLEVRDLNVIGLGSCIGGLVGYNSGDVVACRSDGVVGGNADVGGLVGCCGEPSSDIDAMSPPGEAVALVAQCRSRATVMGVTDVGGLVGASRSSSVWGSAVLRMNCTDGTVMGRWNVGGLAGTNAGELTLSYSTAAVTGIENVGGLAGANASSGDWQGVTSEDVPGLITGCYAAGPVRGDICVGGLVGNRGWDSRIEVSFWDVETAGSKIMCGCDGCGGDDEPDCEEYDNSRGKTTAAMRAVGTFLEAGWDFVDETDNGTDDIWWIDEALDYPRLWWEPASEEAG